MVQEYDRSWGVIETMCYGNGPKVKIIVCVDKPKIMEITSHRVALNSLWKVYHYVSHHQSDLLGDMDDIGRIITHDRIV